MFFFFFYIDYFYFFFFFFFQAEDGIRDLYVTGVQTCALPILMLRRRARLDLADQLGGHREQPITAYARHDLLRAAVMDVDASVRLLLAEAGREGAATGQQPDPGRDTGFQIR